MASPGVYRYDLTWCLQVWPHLVSTGILTWCLQVWPHLVSTGMASPGVYRYGLTWCLQVWSHLVSTGMVSPGVSEGLVVAGLPQLGADGPGVDVVSQQVVGDFGRLPLDEH